MISRNIYKNATEGFVWLHRTIWSNGDSLRLQTFLKAGFAHENFEDTLNDFQMCLESIQDSKPWLTSGWTLQEGVLLQKSILKDYCGEGLSGDFMSSPQASSEGQVPLSDCPEKSP